MRTQEAARTLRVSAVTLRRLDNVGIIHVPRDRNNHRRFDEKSLEEARSYLYPAKAENSGRVPDQSPV
jgi:DNA-binding transcriptional MerR regulator